MDDQNKQFTVIVCILLILFFIWMLCSCSSGGGHASQQQSQKAQKRAAQPNQPMPPPPAEPTDPTAVYDSKLKKWFCQDGCKCDGAGLGQKCIDGSYLDVIDVHEDYTSDFDGLYRKERVISTPLDFGYDLVQVTGDWTN